MGSRQGPGSQQAQTLHMQDDCSAPYSLADRGTQNHAIWIIKRKGAPPGSRVVSEGAITMLPRVVIRRVKSNRVVIRVKAASLPPTVCGEHPLARPAQSSQHLCEKGAIYPQFKKCALKTREVKGLVHSPTVQKCWTGDSTALSSSVLLLHPSG